MYLYGTTVKFSLYLFEVAGLSLTITYRDSALNIISSTSSTLHNSSSQPLVDFELNLDSRFFNESFFIDVQLGSTKIRFEKIKPRNTIEDYTRIYWRNSRGGISFYDFVGEKSETREFEQKTYEKNIFDYYDNGTNELERQYDVDVTYETTVKSHLFTKDGRYIFNDLIQSPYIWTNINNEEYVILLDSVQVEEQDKNDIFQATIKYHLSQKPSLL